MVISRLVLTLCCTFTCAVAAQEGADKSNMACVENLEIPVYPRLAEAARMVETVKSVIRITHDGSVQGVTSELQVHADRESKAMFLKSVEDAVRASKFASSCAGQLVTVEFRFSLGEQIGTERVSFTYPNRFTILAPANVIQGLNPVIPREGAF